MPNDNLTNDNFTNFKTIYKKNNLPDAETNSKRRAHTATHIHTQKHTHARRQPYRHTHTHTHTDTHTPPIRHTHTHTQKTVTDGGSLGSFSSARQRSTRLAYTLK